MDSDDLTMDSAEPEADPAESMEESATEPDGSPPDPEAGEELVKEDSAPSEPGTEPSLERDRNALEGPPPNQTVAAEPALAEARNAPAEPAVPPSLIVEEAEPLTFADVDSDVPPGKGAPTHELSEEETKSAEPPAEETAGMDGPASETATAAPQGARVRTSVRCPVCDRAGKDAATRGDVPYVRCEHCGTIIRAVRPSLGAMARERDERFRHAFARPYQMAIQKAHAQALEVMQGYFRIRRGKPAALGAFGLSLLDVECELGFRMRKFANYGWHVTGTETSPSAYQFSLKQMFDVSEGWLPAIEFGRSRFDLVLFAGCFGRIPDPRAALRKAAKIMNPKGLVCVLSEPLAIDENETNSEAMYVYSENALRKLFIEEHFVFSEEEDGEGDERTFWFEARPGR